MRKIALALLPIVLLACATQKTTSITGAHTIMNECPTQGTCTFEVLKDKSLVIKTNLGKPYYEVADAPGKMVVKYTYNKTKNPAYQDDFYSEEIIFETDNELSNLKDKTTAIPVYFNAKCFCRGKAGTYKVDNAQVSLKDNQLHIALPATIVDNQLLKNIDVSFK